MILSLIEIHSVEGTAHTNCELALVLTLDQRDFKAIEANAKRNTRKILKPLKQSQNAMKAKTGFLTASGEEKEEGGIPPRVQLMWTSDDMHLRQSVRLKRRRWRDKDERSFRLEEMKKAGYVMERHFRRLEEMKQAKENMERNFRVKPRSSG